MVLLAGTPKFCSQSSWTLRTFSKNSFGKAAKILDEMLWGLLKISEVSWLRSFLAREWSWFLRVSGVKGWLFGFGDKISLLLLL